MNKKDLQNLVRQTIQEVLNEDTAADKAAQDAKKIAIDKEIVALQKKKAELSRGPQSSLAETEIDEMANVAVKYQLAPDVAAADFTGKKARIIAAMQDTEEPMSKINVATAMGYDKQNPINADFMALVADGTIVPAGEQAAPRLNRPQPEPVAPVAAADGEEDGENEEPAGFENPEGAVDRDMSDEEVDAMFAKMMAGDEEEPEIGGVEKVAAAAPSMSDKDYDDFMKYTDLVGRLANVKSDILKAKRSRGGAIGDLRDEPTNVDNLRDLKTRLQARIDDLVANSPYLQSRKEKEDKPKELDEWTKNRLQYYAGIKK